MKLGITNRLLNIHISKQIIFFGISSIALVNKKNYKKRTIFYRILQKNRIMICIKYSLPLIVILVLFVILSNASLTSQNDQLGPNYFPNLAGQIRAKRCGNLGETKEEKRQRKAEEAARKAEKKNRKAKERKDKAWDDDARTGNDFSDFLENNPQLTSSP